MKKLKLSMPAVKAGALTREQLKFVMGGEIGNDPCASAFEPCWWVFNCCSGLKCTTDTHVCIPVGST